jgi:tetraacyldisaccharide 4'-kinase
VHAVAGIGHPERFFATRAAVGVCATPHPFPVHHHYTPEDLFFDDADAIVMTEKDAIKCSRFATDRMWSLPVTARIDPTLIERVIDRVSSAASNHPTQRATASTPEN